MSLINDHFDKLLDLLQTEKEHEKKQFEEYAKKLSITEKINNGHCWYPTQVLDSGFSLGEHPCITVERTKHLDVNHSFKAGQVLTIFHLDKTHVRRETKGVIHYIKKHTIKIVMYGTELPRWVFGGHIGVESTFDEKTYIEMEQAVRNVQQADETRLAAIRDIIAGNKEAQISQKHPIEIPQLNHSQNEALNSSLQANDVAVIHGPPGTGKTTTIVQILVQLSKSEGPILVCAPSNAATDHITLKAVENRLHTIRLGHLYRIDENLINNSLEGYIQRLPEMQEVKNMKKEAAQLRNSAGKFKRKFGHQERQDRKNSYIEARELIQHAKMLEDYIIDRTLKNAQVITCTLGGANNQYIEKMHFKTLIIDEAAQALEPACWIAIAKCDRVILAGDPHQLPPTVKSMKAQRGGLSTTLIERALNIPDLSTLLNQQYRMHQMIMQFSNEQFYDGQLTADVSVKNWQLGLKDGSFSKALEFIDTAGCGYEEQFNHSTSSYHNEKEYHTLRMHLDNLLVVTNEPTMRIGIISPYKEQVKYMKDHLTSDFDHFPDRDIQANTIDSFQGQERDVIYISLVRSNEQGMIGFLKDTRRMNVAMTRAKKKLIVIGDSATIGQHPFYNDFIDYCEKNDAYHTAWEWQ